MSETVLVLGATSGIAQATCRVLAARGCQLILSGRNLTELERLAADLKARYGTEPLVELLDVLDFASHEGFEQRVCERLSGPPQGVLLCFGLLLDQEACESDPAQSRQMIDVNFTAAVTLLNGFAAQMRSRPGSYIAAISSVAGDRGRQSNFIYGAAKAGLSTYLAGLRNRLYRDGIHVLTIKPGFVATAMTAGKLNPNSPLVASPERVARGIDRAIRRRANVAYLPWFWRVIMTIICSIPESIFKRLKL